MRYEWSNTSSSHHHLSQASVENQRPHLDALPVLFVKLIRVRKSSMRRPASQNRLVRIKAFDQHDLIWRLPVLVEPSMAWIRQDGEGLLAFSVSQQDRGRDEVRILNRFAVCYGQRIFIDCLDWTPDLVFASARISVHRLGRRSHVDDLEPTFCQLVGFSRELLL
jgi:hypothetical protein